MGGFITCISNLRRRGAMKHGAGKPGGLVFLHHVDFKSRLIGPLLSITLKDAEPQRELFLSLLNRLLNQTIIVLPPSCYIPFAHPISSRFSCADFSFCA